MDCHLILGILFIGFAVGAVMFALYAVISRRIDKLFTFDGTDHGMDDAVEDLTCAVRELTRAVRP